MGGQAPRCNTQAVGGKYVLCLWRFMLEISVTWGDNLPSQAARRLGGGHRIRVGWDRWCFLQCPSQESRGNVSAVQFLSILLRRRHNAAGRNNWVKATCLGNRPHLCGTDSKDEDRSRRSVRSLHCPISALPWSCGLSILGEGLTSSVLRLIPTWFVRWTC